MGELIGGRVVGGARKGGDAGFEVGSALYINSRDPDHSPRRVPPTVLISSRSEETVWKQTEEIKNNIEESENGKIPKEERSR